MHRFTQDTRDAYAWSSSHSRRSTSLITVVEYGLLVMLLMSLVSIGATLMGSKLTSVFSTVASAMEQAAKPQSVAFISQRTNRRGAPILVNGKLPTLTSLFEDAPIASRRP